MKEVIDIPEEALRYILFQRAATVKDDKNLLQRVFDKFFHFQLLSKTLEKQAKSRGEDIKAIFRKDMADEYATIKQYLPEGCSSVLDIGCGVAGIDVCLFRHYGSSDALSFYLLDKSSVNEKVYYSFSEQGAFYSSLPVAKGLLVKNGIPDRNVHTIEADEDSSIDIEGSVDLVISLISWGFHYPVSTYLDRVHELLSPGGSLIMDIRKNTEGEGELKRKFKDTKVIADFKKFSRFLSVK